MTQVTTKKASYEAFVRKAIEGMRGGEFTTKDGEVRTSLGINPKIPAKGWDANLLDTMTAYFGEAITKESCVHEYNSVANGKVSRTLTGASAVLQRLALAGKLTIIPHKNGIMVYLPEDKPASHARVKQAQASVKRLGF